MDLFSGIAQTYVNSRGANAHTKQSTPVNGSTSSSNASANTSIMDSDIFWYVLYGIIGLVAFLIIVSLFWTTPAPSADAEAKKVADNTGTNTSGFVDIKESNASGKRPVSELLATSDMPEEQQCLVNFYALGTRFTGYLGPIVNGIFNPDVAVQLAVNAGCRVFVLDIDYMDDCTGEIAKYFPRIVVRDIHGRFLINKATSEPMCNTPEHSTIRDVCEKINFYAFSSSAQNATDPVIVVLNFLRQPPGSYKSKTVLDYYSHVAKALAPFRDRLITNELEGGTFYRQKQQGRLLINKITDYSGKVLLFSNANTNGFREVNYKPAEDLDFLTNLRLYYTQTKVGVTENDTGAIYGILQTAGDYLEIPSDRADETADNTKLRWTICLSADPSKSVTQKDYDKITKTYGVHCVPGVLFDPEVKFLFTDKYFKTYSFLPKPENLRYIKPPIVVPGEPNPSMNANKGMLRMPTV
jgi:hypothetical protein